MINTKNKISGEVNALSLAVRKYITRHCVTLASYMSARSLSPSKDEQAQIPKQMLRIASGLKQQNNPEAAPKSCEAHTSGHFRIKNHLSLKGVTNR